MGLKVYHVECYSADGRQTARFAIKQTGELPAIAEAKGLASAKGGASFKVLAPAKKGDRVIYNSLIDG